MAAAKQHLTTHDVSKLLEVSPTTVINWIRSGQLECYTTLGGHRRIEREVLQAFLEKHAMPVPEDLSISHRKRILMVDDDPDVLDFMKDILQRDSRYEVMALQDGFEAGVQVGLWKPDLLLLDIRMPGLDGYEVAALLRENPKTKDLPIVVVTGFHSEEDARAIRRAGITDVLYKPFEADDLMAKVKAILQAPKSRAA